MVKYVLYLLGGMPRVASALLAARHPQERETKTLINMSKLLIIICLYLIGGEKKNVAISRYPQRIDTALVITFEDYFKNDKVSLETNKKSILKDEVISSNKVGYTDVEVVFFKKNQHEIITKYENKYINVEHQHKLLLFAVLNGKRNKFVIDLRLGKYVGLSKKQGNRLYIRQSKKPFFYD